MEVLVPNEALFYNRRPSQLRIADSNGGCRAPFLEGEIPLLIPIYQRATRHRARGSTINQAAPSQDISTTLKITNKNFTNHYDDNPYIYALTAPASCNNQSLTALISASWLNDQCNVRIILDKHLPRLEIQSDAEHPAGVHPLIKHQGLYYARVFVTQPCDNPSCEACKRSIEKIPTPEEIKRKLADCTIADALAKAAPRAARVPEAKANPALLDMAEQQRRKQELRESGVNPTPSLRDPRHYHQKRRVTRQQLHMLFGHVGADPDRLNAALKIGAVKGLEMVGDSHILIILCLE